MTTIAWDGKRLATDSRSTYYVNKVKVGIDDSTNKLHLFDPPVKISILGDDNLLLAIAGAGAAPLLQNVAKTLSEGKDAFKIMDDYKKAGLPIDGHADWIIITQKFAGEICSCDLSKITIAEEGKVLACGTQSDTAIFLMSRFRMNAILAVGNAATMAEETSSLVSYAMFDVVDGKRVLSKKETYFFNSDAEVIDRTFKLIEGIIIDYNEGMKPKVEAVVETPPPAVTPPPTPKPKTRTPKK